MKKILILLDKIIFACITLVVFCSIILTFIYCKEVPILINYLRYILIAYIIGLIFIFFKIKFKIRKLYKNHRFYIGIMVWTFYFEITFCRKEKK
jgi:hypothetical protein